MITKRQILFITLIATWSLIATMANVKSQSPQPIVVQAATAPTATSTSTAVSSAVPSNSGSIEAAIKTLEKVKAANDELLKRQQATLQQLDDMQQAAEELKIFSKRG